MGSVAVVTVLMARVLSLKSGALAYEQESMGRKIACPVTIS